MRGLAKQVREAAKKLGRFSPSGLADGVDIRTYRDRKMVKNALYDFVRRGEIRRIGKGLYEYVGGRVARTKLDIIWHLVRSHRSFTADEIERLSGAARPTVLEYLQCLTALGFLRKPTRRRWLLVKDPGPETPVNSAKCKRLKEIRKKAKTGPASSAATPGQGG